MYTNISFFVYKSSERPIKRITTRLRDQRKIQVPLASRQQVSKLQQEN
uniref:Uncharacterized protein n=1 Tax=Rhizophora mucronata TaxID=61149 RepID=A0A2P2NIL5_RHIMU